MTGRVPGPLESLFGLPLDRGTLAQIVMLPPGPLRLAAPAPRTSFGARSSHPAPGKKPKLVDLVLTGGSAWELPVTSKAPPRTRFYITTINPATFPNFEAKIDANPEKPWKPPEDLRWHGGIETYVGSVEKRSAKVGNRPEKQTLSCSSGGVTFTAIIYVIDALQNDFRCRGERFNSDNSPTMRRYAQIIPLAGQVTGKMLPTGIRLNYSDFCESQWLIRPPELFTDAKAGMFKTDSIRFFVHREVQKRAWDRKIQADASLVWKNNERQDAWKNDDDENVMLDAFKANGHLYSNDAPEGIDLNEPPIYIQYVQQQRMREIVKVTFNSTPADQGFPIAPWYTWHHFRSIFWNGTRWVEVPDYGGNDFQDGDLGWGPEPPT
jgi:hypothetical protein